MKRKHREVKKSELEKKLKSTVMTYELSDLKDGYDKSFYFPWENKWQKKLNISKSMNR